MQRAQGGRQGKGVALRTDLDLWLPSSPARIVQGCSACSNPRNAAVLEGRSWPRTKAALLRRRSMRGASSPSACS